MNQSFSNKITVKYGVSETFLTPPIGRTFTERNELITREERAASGKLRRDVIAHKKIFTLSYELIETEAVNKFDKILKYHSDEELTLEIEGSEKTYKVLIMPYEKERFRILNGGLWANVTVEFVEI